jgi:hypothetical protein
MSVEIERPKFFVDLLAEVDAFGAVYPSHDPMEKGETAQGTLSPWLERAYSLARYYYKQTRLLAVERDYENAGAVSRDAEIAELKYKSDLLMEIVWCSVRAELNLWTASNVGLRENFTVIRSEESEDEDGFKKFLRGMFSK